VGPWEELFSRGMEVEEVSWLTATPPKPGDEVRAQIRHRAPDVPARIVAAGDGLTLRFTEPQRAVTPGQSAALFQGERLLGGGRIARALSGAPANPAAVASAQ
jgi:tRNA-uridine 2-sulfurtransferase